MPKIYLYAEILTHIRQLSLHASLQTAKTEGTKVDVSTDKKVITVEHDGETQKLYLPTQISGTAQVIFPILKDTEVSARVQIDDEHEWKCNINHEIEAPWMASHLTKDTIIQCRQCNATIIPSGKVLQWKDLPSENWAELMDFWFCHKPHDEQQNPASEAAEAKGFSPQSRLAVAQGVGMTDLVSMVLHSSDCQNIKASATDQNPEVATLTCCFCDSFLGTAKTGENLVRLSKCNIAVNKAGSTTIFQSYAAAVFICAQILSLIEATALKRFVVHSAASSAENRHNPAEIEPLIMWIFNPDLYYSCSAYDGNGILPNITSSATDTANSHGDDISQIYSDHKVELPHRSSSHSQNGSESSDKVPGAAERSGSVKGPIFEDHRNPNQDDTSQIYGPSQGPQILAGDLKFEIPLPDRQAKETSDNTLRYIEPIADHETPLISAKSKRDEKSIAQPSLQSNHGSGSNSTEHVNLVHRATKIFYKPLPAGDTATSFLDANSTTHEELLLSSPAELVELRATLERSNAMLPASAKVFQEWKVGLLDRYEKNPSGFSVMQENPLARGIKVKDGRVTRWSIGDGAEGLYA